MVLVMKAQFEVSEEVWGRVKVASMLACKSIGEMVEPVLSEAFPKGGFVDLKVGKVVFGPAKSEPQKVPPVSRIMCFTCGGELGSDWTVNKEGKRLCQACAKKSAGVK